MLSLGHRYLKKGTGINLLFRRTTTHTTYKPRKPIQEALDQDTFDV